MSEWFTVKMGSYVFEAAPGVEPEVERIVREGPDPCEAVACNYTIALACRVRETEDDTAAAVLGDFLSRCVHTRTCPPIYVLDEAGEPVPEWGEIDPDATDAAPIPANLGWEDVRLVSYRLPAGDGQLMAGASFAIVVRARRSFPDSDGICELEQSRFVEEDSQGNPVERLVTSYVRFARAGGANVETPAVVARIKLAAPVGFVRTIGGSLGYIYEEPLYPERHVARGIVSEITLAGIAGGAGGSKDATLGHRVSVDPARGLRRLTDTASTTGGSDPRGWIDDMSPGAAVVSSETTHDEGSENAATGEWRRIEISNQLGNGKTTKVVRTFTLRGGSGELGAIKITRPIRPTIQRGPLEAWSLVETVEVYAVGPASYADFALPEPLGPPWALGPVEAAEPRVSEEALVPELRVWVWAVNRPYLWDGEGSPRDHVTFKGAVFAQGQEVYSP